MKKNTYFKYAKVLICILMSFSAYARDGIALPTLGGGDVYSDNKDATLPSTQSEKNEKNVESRSAQTLMSEAQQNFQNLTVDGATNQLYQYGKSAVTSTAQSKVEALLSPYGHVRTNLTLNDGSLDGSSLDYLIPWYAGESTLLFNQFSTHSKDGRNIANLGAGVRYNLNKDWLVGVNAFYDYDISRGHRRGSVGTEVWTNYLKFSGNYYIPLSEWKTSKDFDNYEERPAEGWDVRLQTYLPSYPQLGASLVYEQYYGDQVALFGIDDLQEDPSAVTVGVDYTPVPLVTMGVGYKKGNTDSTELTANIAVDYHIGVPISKQLDPSAVSAMRTLAGSRMDFFDRNNDIVLEYREVKDLDIDTYLKPTGTAPQCIISDQPDLAEAYEGCHWTLNADIKSHRKIKSAQWVPVGGFSAESALGLPALSPQSNIGAGKDNHWTLTFPAWVNSAASNANEYQLAVTITDDNGNTKQSNVVKIKVVEAPVSYQLLISNSPNNNKAIKQTANGKNTVELAATGTKVSGLQGETTSLPAENTNMKFHIYSVSDKNQEHEVTIHNSQSECDKTSGCIYYVKSPTQGNTSIASTLPGVFTAVATPIDDDTKKTNSVYIEFSAGNKDIVTAIVDVQNPNVNLTELKGNKLQSGHEYQFRVAYDSNGNGKWDTSDRENISDTNPTLIASLVNYKWVFDGVNDQGEKGGYANQDTNNHNLTIPVENAQATQVFAAAGKSGIQGYELKVDFEPSSAGLKLLNTASSQ
jgi:adhesin/invasin